MYPIHFSYCCTEPTYFYVEHWTEQKCNEKSLKQVKSRYSARGRPNIKPAV